jgi:hypothetical protein
MMKVRAGVCKTSKWPEKIVKLVLTVNRITTVVTRLQQESSRIKLEKVFPMTSSRGPY